MSPRPYANTRARAHHAHVACTCLHLQSMCALQARAGGTTPNRDAQEAFTHLVSSPSQALAPHLHMLQGARWTAHAFTVHVCVCLAQLSICRTARPCGQAAGRRLSKLCCLPLMAALSPLRLEYRLHCAVHARGLEPRWPPPSQGRRRTAGLKPLRRRRGGRSDQGRGLARGARWPDLLILEECAPSGHTLGVRGRSQQHAADASPVERAGCVRRARCVRASQLHILPKRFSLHRLLIP